jgi:hypothetical protein
LVPEVAATSTFVTVTPPQTGGGKEKYSNEHATTRSPALVINFVVTVYRGPLTVPPYDTRFAP